MRTTGLLEALSCMASLAPLVSGLPFTKRAVIAHDAVVGFPETVPSGDLGNLYLKYKPRLKVFNGCVPFPAVEADGDTSGGLSPTGSPSGGCSPSTGQVYARAAQHGSAYAIMYSWYMPKDSPSSGLGHRHEWEHIVVWLSGPDTSATVLGVAVSQHGGHEKSTAPPMSGNTPLVGYTSVWPVNHQMIFTDEVGGTQPLIAWESLTEAARTALTNTDFGDANVPFKDSNFANELDDAQL
ncbi:related to NPP1 domain protein [Cephalotrichum gorgonifer]|uniref:Related to NPP1 domain protein n=1 Tax=Cephalotrichum gorgonifer TaxID=2041049 RepID=A0AAE8N0U1_9PEZI|nr:related to NPP1 domain protein [Cephalotrichum gorgonifer]